MWFAYYSLGKNIRSKLKLNISNCVHTVMNQRRCLDPGCQELWICEIGFDITHMSTFYWVFLKFPMGLPIIAETYQNVHGNHIWTKDTNSSCGMDH